MELCTCFINLLRPHPRPIQTGHIRRHKIVINLLKNIIFSKETTILRHFTRAYISTGVVFGLYTNTYLYVNTVPSRSERINLYDYDRKLSLVILSLPTIHFSRHTLKPEF